ncbi:glycosyltransferase family 4 protein [uncultured Nocardioides sp.]|uniref:glycosyltransferase family 4 protein n=1 Tax=uncultured Nocardioides sp. TaxID=198441 RepID=UPI0026088E27|nr:glycosyltransferase family 4 protein [uncultured Nocardioides sp.]
MSTLVLASRAPTSPTSGYDLRVRHLCEHTPGPLHLAVVRLAADDGPDRPVSGDAVAGFASTTWVDDLLVGATGLRRHLRRSDADWLRTSRPAGYAAARGRLEALVAEHDVDLVVVFGGDLAELVPGGERLRTVLDVCDSAALTRRRGQEVAPPTGARERLRAGLALARTRALEASLPARFDEVVAISAQDTAELVALAPSGAQVATVPNGVDDRFLTGMLPPGDDRVVGFWGNLVFGPNQEALRYFLLDVHDPLLRPHGVGVRVIGPNAPDWLVAHAAADPLVDLVGFVPELSEALAGVPVAINAMRSGSGLKNKVLEAFGMGLVVVTTTRGIEAVGGARDGEHVLVADSPEDLAAAVLAVLDDPSERDRLRTAAHALLAADYRWEAVGARWRALVEGGEARSS